MFEFSVVHTNVVLFSDLFVLGEGFEDGGCLLDVDDERGELEDHVEMLPGLVDDFVVVFSLGEGEVGVLKEEGVDCLDAGLEVPEGFFNGG